MGKLTEEQMRMWTLLINTEKTIESLTKAITVLDCGKIDRYQLLHIIDNAVQHLKDCHNYQESIIDEKCRAKKIPRLTLVRRSQQQ